VPNEVVVRGEARSNDPLKLTAQVEHMIGCFKEAVARAAVTVDGKAVHAELEYRSVPSYVAMNVPEDAPIVRKVIEAARRLGREVKPHATGGGCDANIFNQRGLVVANLGTGMRDIHTVREWLDVRDMTATAEVTLLSAASRITATSGRRVRTWRSNSSPSIPGPRTAVMMTSQPCSAVASAASLVAQISVS